MKPEQPHQMAVSTNHNLGGCVIQLTSYLIDMKNYRGFQGYSPFHIDADTDADADTDTDEDADRQTQMLRVNSILVNL